MPVTTRGAKARSEATTDATSSDEQAEQATRQATAAKGPMAGAWYGVAVILLTFIAAATGLLDEPLAPFEHDFKGKVRPLLHALR